MLQLRLLGPFELRRADGLAVPLPGRQSKALLACLASADQSSMGRQRLASLIWPDRGTEQANGSLRQELLRLRRLLGETALPATEKTLQPVRLDTITIDVDVVRFRMAAVAPGGVAAAVSLYRGPLLQDFPLRPRDPFSDWLAVQRQQLQDVARLLMLRMLRAGEGNPALAERLLAVDPLCEEAYAYLIRHYAALHDLSQARGWFESCAAALGAAGLETSFEVSALIEDAQAATNRTPATSFKFLQAGPAPPAAQLLPEGKISPDLARRPAQRRMAELSERRSLVVLPFDDMTELSLPCGRPLGDILTEETTAALARLPGLFVAARHSAMAYCESAMDVRLIAAELGVRYLLEGSVIRGRSSIYCNIRLIDGHTGLHIWAARIDGGDDTMALRDRILHETTRRLMPR